MVEGCFWRVGVGGCCAGGDGGEAGAEGKEEGWWEWGERTRWLAERCSYTSCEHVGDGIRCGQ